MLKNIYPINTVIFDFDGVIVNSMDNNLRAWQLALAPHNIVVCKNEYYLLEGASAKDVATYFLKKRHNIADVVKSKERYYKDGPKSFVYHGVKAFLATLRAEGAKLGLVTGGARSRVEPMIMEHNMKGYFDSIITAEDTTHAKPHPDPYLKALAQLGNDIEQTVVIENAPLGIQSAKRAGLMVFALGTSLPAYELTQADCFFINHQALYKFFNKSLEKN